MNRVARFTIETLRLADVPDAAVRDEAGVLRAIDMRSASEPPPIVVYRHEVRRGRETETRVVVYDGLRRIAAAKRSAAITIRAAVCPTRVDAERLREEIRMAGGPTNFFTVRHS